MKNNKLTQSILALVAIAALSAATGTAVHAQDTVEEYLREYPNLKQVEMMETWLKENEKGTFRLTGLVDPTDTTVVTPQATVNYAYNWFSVSDGPAIVRVPKYDKFSSVSVFDMKHNVPAVIVSPEKPILIKRPGQKIPEDDFHIVEMETDQGLLMTRYVVVDNLDYVMKLREKIVMEGGKGEMTRNVQRFSPETEKNAHAVMDSGMK